MAHSVCITYCTYVKQSSKYSVKAAVSHVHTVTHITNSLVHVTFYVILFRLKPHSSQDR